MCIRDRLIGSFGRKQERRRLGAILLAWHEFAVHKTVETRSRSQLRVSLKAQEALTAAAEGALDEYAKVLVDAERALDGEARTQSTLQRQAEEARTELASLRLKCHAAQQETLRLRTLVRHYELRYPKAFATTAPAPQAAAASDAGGGGGGGGGGGTADGAARVDVSEPGGGGSPAGAPPAPLIISRDEAERLHRLHAAAGAILSTCLLYTSPSPRDS